VFAPIPSASVSTAIAVKPGDESLARWQNQIPLCPLVAGMPKADGEYILSRVSKIATAAGAPLAPANCKGNFFIVVTSDPEGVIKAWSKRDVRMFGDEADQGGATIRKFNADSPVRLWYNAEFYELDGTPLGNNVEGREDLSARATRADRAVPSSASTASIRNWGSVITPSRTSRLRSATPASTRVASWSASTGSANSWVPAGGSAAGEAGRTAAGDVSTTQHCIEKHLPSASVPGTGPGRPAKWVV